MSDEQQQCPLTSHQFACLGTRISTESEPIFFSFRGVSPFLFLGFLVSLFLGSAMTWIGFTTTCIAAGSLAASTQSSMGRVASGSAFSSFQSTGTHGGFHKMRIVGAIGCGVIVGAYFYTIFENVLTE